jgi:tetratricopeptide (TPR) repeat protein
MEGRHSVGWPRKVHSITWYCDMDHDPPGQFETELEWKKHMQDLNNHPRRRLKPPTEAQLDALSARKQQLVQRDQYVCPLCEQIPKFSEKIQLLMERGNPVELSHLLTEHIAQHIMFLSLISLPCLDSDPADAERESTKFENSLQRLLNPGSVPRPPSGKEYIDNDSLSFHSSTSEDEMPETTETSGPQPVRRCQTGKSYDVEYSDYEPPKPLPNQENLGWVKFWLTWKEERDGLHKESGDTDPVGEQPQLDEAARMKKEVLEKRRRILGEEHPDTITAMSNLAITLGEQGQLEEAARIEKEVLENMRRIFGENHLSTISAMKNLAITLGEQGQLEEAARIEKEVLQKRKRILGANHPATLSAMSNLAITLGEQGQLEEAARIEKEILEEKRRILGEEHLDTIAAMNNLANTLGEQGQLDEAARMEKEVLENMRRIFSENHPFTISAMKNLAITLGEQGQLKEAARIEKEVLQKRKRIFGENHPSIISAMSNLAITLADQGQLNEAIEMMKEVLEKRSRFFGEEHPDTITAMNNLASTLGDQGHLDEAVEMMQKVVPGMTRIFGEEHPKTRVAKANLARLSGTEALPRHIPTAHAQAKGVDFISLEAQVHKVRHEIKL